jgi:hypothetical protein
MDINIDVNFKDEPLDVNPNTMEFQDKTIDINTVKNGYRYYKNITNK